MILFAVPVIFFALPLHMGVGGNTFFCSTSFLFINFVIHLASRERAMKAAVH